MSVHLNCETAKHRDGWSNITLQVFSTASDCIQ